jgi:hypothetical protein
MQKLFFIVLSSLVLISCSSPPVFYNMTPKQLKTEENLYKSWTVNKGIQEIQEQLSINGENCGPNFGIQVNQFNSKKAIYQRTIAGFSDSATIFVMEFDENKEGLTLIKAWSNDSIMFPKTFADKLIQAIHNPYKCDGSF